MLGAIALGLLAWWVKINASQLAGPVMLPEASGSDSDKDLNTILRVAVLRNLPEPGRRRVRPGPTRSPTCWTSRAGRSMSSADPADGPGLAGRRYDIRSTSTWLARCRRRQQSQPGHGQLGDRQSNECQLGGDTHGCRRHRLARFPGTTTALIRVIAVSGGVLPGRLFSSSVPGEAVRSRAFGRPDSSWAAAPGCRAGRPGTPKPPVRWPWPGSRIPDRPYPRGCAQGRAGQRDSARPAGSLLQARRPGPAALK